MLTNISEVLLERELIIAILGETIPTDRLSEAIRIRDAVRTVLSLPSISAAPAPPACALCNNPCVWIRKGREYPTKGPHCQKCTGFLCAQRRVPGSSNGRTSAGAPRAESAGSNPAPGIPPRNVWDDPTHRPHVTGAKREQMRAELDALMAEIDEAGDETP